MKKTPKTKFGISLEKYKEIVEIGCLSSYYGFNEKQANRCYEKHITCNIPLETAFELYYLKSKK